MFEIRRLREADTAVVAALISDTFGAFNLRDMTAAGRAAMLGPFSEAGSTRPERREAIALAISAPSVWVAEQDGEIVGVLRGGRTDERGRTVLSSLFVAGDHHRQGIGRALVERFEHEYVARGVKVFKVAATSYSVPFYLSVGYNRSTGVRTTSSFGEPGLPYQPMKKKLE